MKKIVDVWHGGFPIEGEVEKPIIYGEQLFPIQVPTKEPGTWVYRFNWVLTAGGAINNPGIYFEGLTGANSNFVLPHPKLIMAKVRSLITYQTAVGSISFVDHLFNLYTPTPLVQVAQPLVDYMIGAASTAGSVGVGATSNTPTYFQFNRSTPEAQNTPPFLLDSTGFRCLVYPSLNAFPPAPFTLAITDTLVGQFDFTFKILSV